MTEVFDAGAVHASALLPDVEMPTQSSVLSVGAVLSFAPRYEGCELRRHRGVRLRTRP